MLRRTCRDLCSGWWCGSFGHGFVLLRVLVHESTPTGLPVMMVYSSHGTPSLRMLRALGLGLGLLPDCRLTSPVSLAACSEWHAAAQAQTGQSLAEVRAYPT